MTYIKKIVFCLVSLLSATTAWGQVSNVYDDYINKYSDLAVEQMNAYRIPASITLAQGLLESNAGRSTLSRVANNHFGIKCTSDWKGDYFVQDDDYKNEHFRVYGSAKESYIDHSKFLSTRGRYSFLFKLDITDYKGWARGLKQAGYATNARYGDLLIDLIERYELFRYDRKRYPHQHNVTTVEKQAEHRVYFNNKNYYIIARAGDTFEQISKEWGVSKRKLIKYNELDKHYVLQDGDIVYLQKKQKRAESSFKNYLHVVQAGESYYSIAQKYGIRMKYLYKMNNLMPDASIYEGKELLVR